MPRRPDPAAPAPALTLTLERARAHWHRREGLAEPRPAPPEALVAETGWPRTLGGVEAYLALRARIPGLGRADLDGAVAGGRLQVLPAARGCIYLVPRTEAALALRVAHEVEGARGERDIVKAGSSWKEVEELARATRKLLARGPLTTDGIRKALPPGAVRSLGERGKKVGISSPLPVALRLLEFTGEVERVPETGRLDTERYLWRLPVRPPGPAPAVPSDPAERHGRLARVFFRHAGPASLAHFAAWSGLGQTAARAALQRAALVPVAVEGHTPLAWLLEDQLPELEGRAAPSRRVALLGLEDTYLTAHGELAPLVDPRHHDRQVGVWGRKGTTTLGAAAHISWRPILEGDRVAGFWEYDPGAREVVCAPFDPPGPALRKALAAEGRAMAAFLEGELGHARSFSLDTTEEVARRAALLRSP